MQRSLSSACPGCISSTRVAKIRGVVRRVGAAVPAAFRGGGCTVQVRRRVTARRANRWLSSPSIFRVPIAAMAHVVTASTDFSIPISLTGWVARIAHCDGAHAQPGVWTSPHRCLYASSCSVPDGKRTGIFRRIQLADCSNVQRRVRGCMGISIGYASQAGAVRQKIRANELREMAFTLHAAASRSAPSVSVADPHGDEPKRQGNLRRLSERAHEAGSVGMRPLSVTNRSFAPESPLSPCGSRDNRRWRDAWTRGARTARRRRRWRSPRPLPRRMAARRRRKRRASPSMRSGLRRGRRRRRRMRWVGIRSPSPATRFRGRPARACG